MAETTKALARTQGNTPAPVAAHRSNLIALSEEVVRLTPFHVIKTRQVKLDPDPRAGDVYDAKFIAPGMLGLAKNGLLKMARTAGAILLPEACRYLVSNGLVYGQNGSPPTYIAELRNTWQYQAVLLWAGADGRPMPAIGSKEVDLRDDSEAILNIRSNDKKQRWAQDKEISQLRQFGSLMAETKAILRACRQILQVKPAYTAAELAVPFEVQCFEFCPDLSDPEVRSIVIAQGQTATAALFGHAQAPAALEAPRAPVPEPTPEAFPSESPSGGWGDPDDYDPETGEVVPQGAEDAGPEEDPTVAFAARIAEAQDIATLNAIGSEIHGAALGAEDKRALRAAWETKKRELS